LTEKLELVEHHREEHGLNRCLELLGVSKGTWHRRMRHPEETKQEARDRQLKGPVLQVVKEHPAYGYRRMLPELLETFGERVNHKRLRRVLNQWDLALPRRVSKPRPSGIDQILRQGKGQLNLLQGWDPGPLEALSTDFTEVRYAGRRKKAYLMALIDIGSHWIPGWALGPSANQDLALTCWKRAGVRLEAAGRGTNGLIVHQDQDSVFTSYRWLRTLLMESEVIVSYSERGAKDNPWIESFWGHFKGENGSLLIEAETLEELREVVDRQMAYYNERRRHSSLDYRSPVEYLKSEGIHVDPLAQTALSTGSAAGAQVRAT
jgi:putative transposase